MNEQSISVDHIVESESETCHHKHIDGRYFCFVLQCNYAESETCHHKQRWRA